MENVKEIFEELRSLMGKMDEASSKRRDEISLWIKEHSDDKEVKSGYGKFMNDGLDEIGASVDKLRDQLESVYDLLPLSYIASCYFGKSRAWLYQRLNGYKVRGKVYTLSAEQKQTFNAAIKDIAKKIGSVHLS